MKWCICCFVHNVVSDHYWAYEVVCVLLYLGNDVYDCHSYCVHEVG